MRFDGKLEKWNDDRGFGFIAPAHGGDSVFVHISAFPRSGERPRVGEVLSYELEPTAGGKRRAVNVQRPGQRPASRSAAATRQRPANVGRRRTGSSFLGRLIAILLVAAVGVYGYTAYSGKRAQTAWGVPSPESASPAERSVAPIARPYRCDGRTHCSQMTSCAEATFFLRNCPGVKMDGDNDGIPCEDQWCQGPSSR